MMGGWMKMQVCVVPFCKNSSLRTPKKLFIVVPHKSEEQRTVWLELAKLDPSLYSKKTRLFFCEDHFNLENDMSNYMNYKLLGSIKRVRMKPNCVPSRFDCQLGTPLSPLQGSQSSTTLKSPTVIKKAEQSQDEIEMKSSENINQNMFNDVKIESKENDEWLRTIKTEALHVGELIIKDEVNLVECSNCFKVFNTKMELLEHKCELMFQCGHCNELFLTNSEFIFHQRVHTGEIPTKCFYSDKFGSYIQCEIKTEVDYNTITNTDKSIVENSDEVLRTVTKEEIVDHELNANIKEEIIDIKCEMVDIDEVVIKVEDTEYS